MNRILLNGENLTIDQVYQGSKKSAIFEIDPAAFEKIGESRHFIEKILDDGLPHYGINTGFGDFANVRISRGDLAKLQVNLIRSHSAGVGEPLSTKVVRAMMILRANTLCRGNSGIRRSVIETLLNMLNSGVHPVVPSRGSVGASGDLAPLSHIALSMIGEGRSEYKDEILPGGEALKRAGIKPVELMEKEGLALINGTQMMTSIGALAAEEISRLLKAADVIAAATVEALLGTDSAFLPQIQQARPHPGQIQTAKNMLALMKNSQIITSHKNCPKVQDAYSLRCIPAVHGAAREGLSFAEKIIDTEMNSSLDNPLVFPDCQMVLSGGNFHGAPIALVLETLAVSLSFVANISERRTERMVNRHYSGLPAFLARDGGLNSGFMIAHYTAAALASENKVLCHPACCDTIPTSAGQEDHVSMGSISALKLINLIKNTWTILGVETLCACEALEHRRPLKPGLGTEIFYNKIRSEIPSLHSDRPVGEDIQKAFDIISSEGFIASIEEKIGRMHENF